ncbi:MAG: hypothetical protein HY400_03680 [Elusimicrobia bacterium]|nr:hypothetical protein [Elusimicrobiota bacterium]
MGTELYIKFLLSLAVGLTGLCIFLQAAVESILEDWDPFQIFRIRKQEKQEKGLEPLETTPRELATRLTARQIGRNMVATGQE